MGNLVFQHPAFLAALSALAIPIIIHLINRKLAKRLVFPSIKFIHKAQRLQTGRKQIRDWLVLLMRIAVLALIALLFSSPVWMKPTPATAQVRDEEVVLLYDVSASMNIAGVAEELADHTRRITGEHPNARFTILTSSNTVGGRVSTADTATVLETVATVARPTYLPGDHYNTLIELERIFDPNSTANAFVYIFSDLQRHDWSPASLPELNIRAAINLVRIGAADAANCAILKVIPEMFFRDNVRRLRATVLVHNYALEPVRARIRVKAGRTSNTLDVELRGNYSEKFVVDLEAPAANAAVAELEIGEAYTLDNAYHFWIGPEPPTRVLVIAEDAAGSRASIESLYLRKALSVSLPGTEKYDVTMAAPDVIWTDPLDDYECVMVLDALADYGESEVEVLGAYIRAGGSLIYFSGRKTPENLVKFNNAGITTTRFLGFQGEINQLRSFTIQSINRESRVVSIFDEEQGDLYNFPIYKLAKFQRSSASTPLLTTIGDNPFLLEENIEKGTLYLFATSLSNQWSEFPTSLSFLPLLHQLVSQSVSGKRTGIVEYTIGDTITTQFTRAGLPENLRLRLEPGIEVIQNVPVEVNITREESDLRSISEYEVSSRLSAATVVAADAAGRDATAGFGHSLARPLAWALLACFVLELIVANRRTGGRQQL